ncbi:hypothetical protein ACFSKW_08760 [Nonomuraea mangrovi]|uniref:Uncharacterized protein n=1 Tax=Nonomuraea mangrovi TaxID=2316207 RepID=A0ABW4SPR0_9ACTN
MRSPQANQNVTSPSRPTAPKGPSSPGNPANGYDTHAGFVRKFAGTMDSSATGVHTLKEHTPVFEGWNLVPLAGIPIVGLPFVGRFNNISNTWRDSAGILGGVLRTDSGKLFQAADVYTAADRAGTLGKK